jgi:hypothetical protein
MFELLGRGCLLSIRTAQAHTVLRDFSETQAKYSSYALTVKKTTERRIGCNSSERRDRRQGESGLYYLLIYIPVNNCRVIAERNKTFL